VELLSTIYPDDPRGKLLKAASTYIWDEGPMSTRDVLACVEEVCRRVNENDRPFGGKVVILIGDFRQTCPVIRRGTKAQVLNASIKASPLWPLFKIFPLTEPIRNAEDRPFADFVDTVGEGAGPSVQLEMLKTVTSAEEITNFVYPTRVLRDPTSCLRRAILAPTHRQVDEYNRSILKQVEGESRTYIADDTLTAAEGLPSDTALLDDLLPTTQLDMLEDATKLVEPSIPVYNLRIQTNAVYRLMRNLNIEQGLVKNAKVVVTALANHHVTVRTLSQLDVGRIARYSEDRIIPRILFTTELPSGYILERRQFPLAPAYATTFHSCIGLTLDVLGVDLTRPVFGHGQLYTALSRIRHRSHARVRLRPGQSKTKNITYEELL
jgi:ATP-dependent DNA helicase PIF1